MPQSLANVLIHTVFSTKHRQPFLREEQLRDEMHRYLGGVAKTLGCQPLTVGGVEDHVHLLTTLSRTSTIADFVKETKRVSTVWVQGKGRPGFHWQAGYGVFSVGQSEVERVRAYIRDQAVHHTGVSFQEEYRKVLAAHGIEFDERYVWD